MPLHFKLRSVDLEVKYASWGRGLNGVLTLYYVLLFFCFCKTLFLTKQSLKGFHYNVELLLAGKGKADTFLFIVMHQPSFLACQIHPLTKYRFRKLFGSLSRIHYNPCVKSLQGNSSII